MKFSIYNSQSDRILVLRRFQFAPSRSSRNEMKLLLLLLLLFSTSTVMSANILGLFPVPGRSHFQMPETLLQELARRGHNVDVATHFLTDDPPPRYNELSLLGSMPVLTNNVSVHLFKDFKYYEMIRSVTKEFGVDVCAATLNTPALQSLKMTKTKYDLVITQIFGSDCMLGFGYLFSVPTVSMITSVVLPWGGDRFGNPDNPSYIPTYYNSFTPEMSLGERIQNAVTLISSKFFHHYYGSEASNAVARKFFGANLPTLEELALKTSLLLVNSHYSMNGARPMVPNVVEIGGLHIRKPKNFTQHFENLLTTDINRGVIYLTMGSMVATETFEPDKLQAMFDAFGELPYKVLWKAVRRNFPNNLSIPKNIHFEQWMPQIDILCHPNVKLFISHGGQLGSQEAVYCGVPRLGIPIFSDQKYNIRNAEKMGIAIELPYDAIDKRTLKESVQRILDDPSFKNNCERVSKQFKDRPMTPLETAVFWIEYVIRHGGAPELRSAGSRLTWYQYYLIDVVAVLIFSSVVSLLLVVVILRAALKAVLNRSGKLKSD